MGEAPKAADTDPFLVKESQSTALSERYSSLYTERQILNWTPVDVVVTDYIGRQQVLPKWGRCLNEMDKYTVDIEVREINGSRTTTDKFGNISDAAIPTKKYSIQYDKFIHAPLKLRELGIILSTVEQSMIAKNMATSNPYEHDVPEALSDSECSDPRFVFVVEDPDYRWENLWVNVLGQTICVRASHTLGRMADIDAYPGDNASGLLPTLTCYLRYPSNLSFGERKTQQMFQINLDTIDMEEPYLIESGEVVCVAQSPEALQRVILKKHQATQAQRPQVKGMIPKEVHEAIVKDLESKIKQERDNGIAQLKAANAQKSAEVADLKFKLDEEKRKVEQLNNQLSNWNALHASMTERVAREDKLMAQQEKTRKESYDASREELDHVWTATKIGATACAGILSFAITLLVKSKK